jgi:hypothetical protein
MIVLLLDMFCERVYCKILRFLPGAKPWGFKPQLSARSTDENRAKPDRNFWRKGRVGSDEQPTQVLVTRHVD